MFKKITKKQQVINNLVTEFGKVSSAFSNITHKYAENCYYLFSNEKYTTKVFDKLSSMPKRHKSDIQVGIVIGHSHIESLLSAVRNSLDILIVLDVNKTLLQNIECIVKSLASSTCINEFLENHKKNIKKAFPKKAFKEINDDASYYYKKSARKSVEDKNYFLKKTHFKLLQNTMKTIKIVTMRADINDSRQIGLLDKVFSTFSKANDVKVKISLFNVSNVPDYSRLKKETIESILRYCDANTVFMQSSVDLGSNFNNHFFRQVSDYTGLVSRAFNIGVFKKINCPKEVEVEKHKLSPKIH